MEKEQINLHVNGDKVTILHGLLNTPKEPLKVEITGNIDTISRYLEKKEIEIKDSHVIINRENLTVTLITDERDPYKKSVIIAGLEISEDVMAFEINSGKQYSPRDLAEMLKMNRYCFSSKEQANKLITDLMNFKAKIDREIEQKNDNRGNVSAVKHQVVQSNLPEVFSIDAEIYKGTGKKNIPIEVVIHADTLACQLVSAEFNELKKEVRDSIIDTEMAKIKSLQPELLIIEC